MKFRYGVAFAALIFSVMSANVLSAPLITPKEAKLPDAAGSLNTRGISRGPGIKVVSPEPGMQTKGPFDFKVVFEPRGGATIDKSSVKVTYMKSPSIDLTPRLLGSVSDTGIDMKNAEIPPGEHPVKISGKDSDGREATTMTTLVGAK